MSEVTPDKLEASQQQTFNRILMWAAGFLMLLVQGFFTYVVTSAGSEVRETNRSLNDIVATVKVQQAQMTFVQRQVDDLISSKKEAADVHKGHDTRLNTVEQRLALHDQWIAAHNK